MLKEVEAFLNENPNEIVTTIVEDYVHTPKGLTRVFAGAGLDKVGSSFLRCRKRVKAGPL